MKRIDLTDEACFRIIKHFQLNIDYELDEEDEESVVEVTAFPMKTGGYHGRGETIEEAIVDCIRRNRLRIEDASA